MLFAVSLSHKEQELTVCLCASYIRHIMRTSYISLRCFVSQWNVLQHYISRPKRPLPKLPCQSSLCMLQPSSLYNFLLKVISDINWSTFNGCLQCLHTESKNEDCRAHVSYPRHSNYYTNQTNDVNHKNTHMQPSLFNISSIWHYLGVNRGKIRRDRWTHFWLHNVPTSCWTFHCASFPFKMDSQSMNWGICKWGRGRSH